MKENHKSINCIMIVLLFVSMLVIAKEAAEYVSSNKVQGPNLDLIVIDAGHGADDAGKVGINKALEKDINLSIALRVKELLKGQDIRVVMTRKDDRGMYPKTGDNRKLKDMQKRVEFINKEQAALTVSIHQNSYTDESISGAQTFYYTGSEEGKKAAEIMQDQLVKTLDPDNHRLAKENGSYYLLKNVKSPIVIAECGFLSNHKEAELLCDEEYQKKVAWAIHLGVLRYINTVEQKGTESTYEMDPNSN